MPENKSSDKNFLSKVMKKFGDWLNRNVIEYLESSEGRKSSMRLAAIFVTFLVFSLWSILSYQSGKLIKIPQGVWISVAILWGTKSLQKYAEQLT